MKTYRWLAIVTGLVSSFFFLTFLFRDELPDLLRRNTADLLPFLPLFIVAIAGFVLALFSERAGAYILLISSIGMLLYHALAGANLGIGLLFAIPYLVTAVLFIAHAVTKDFPRLEGMKEFLP